MIWKVRNRRLSMDSSGLIMGILNATPDSFSDGGQHDTGRKALDYALQMVVDGAGVIDIGGESTRPGAPAVAAEQEIARVVPLVRELRELSDVLISVDTSKAGVARAALEAGADIVNDVTGLTGPESGSKMVDVCAEFEAGVVVMHMQGSPRTMQQNPEYVSEGGVVAEIGAYFQERLEFLVARGLDRESLCFDPGIGFGKTLEHNLALLRHLGGLQRNLARPLLLGVSRKSMIGAVTGVDIPQSRDIGTAALTAMACQQGVCFHRVHDVPGNRQAILLAEAVAGCQV